MLWANHESGGSEDSLTGPNSTCSWGVLSGIVLRGWESQPHGEGPDGSTQLAKETYAGHVGSAKHKPTSLRGIAKKAIADKQHRFRDFYSCLNVDFLLSCWPLLNKNAASGVDEVTWYDYAEDLHDNIEALVGRLKSKRYRARLVRRHYISKGKDKLRPLGIPVIEDKLVQLACTRLLSAIYEQEFMESSYGYRPGRSARDAIGELTFNLQFGNYGHVVEADIKGFFNNMDHDWLLKMLGLRIDDSAFLGLIGKWLKAGILETDGRVIHPDTGTPQGGVISPILANVYLHYALDIWFEKAVKPHCQGEAYICRYADDWVCAFRYENDADRFYRVLPDRLDKFNLEIAPEKTRILRFNRFRPSMKRRFTFLSFEFFWKRIVKVYLVLNDVQPARSYRQPVRKSNCGSSSTGICPGVSSSRDSILDWLGITTTMEYLATLFPLLVSLIGRLNVPSNGLIAEVVRKRVSIGISLSMYSTMLRLPVPELRR